MKKFYSDIQALCGLTVSGTTTLSTATGVTRTTSDNSTHLATTAFVKNQGYITAAALAGYVPTSRTLTINGVSYDLTANRSWTISSADGYISNVQLNGNSLDFTGQGSAFSGSIDLSAIVPTVRTVYERVKNTSGAIIYKGTPLAVVPGQTSGNISDVVPADAADPAKMPAVFIANEDMADEAEGEAVLFGRFSGVNTSLYSSGTVVYVAPGGGWTATKPVHPNLIQNLGVITKQHATNGGGIVTGVGRANSLPNLTAGKIWVGTTNYPIESTTVHIDETNNRVGINTNTPNDILVVSNGSGEVRFGGGNGRTLSAYAGGTLANFDFYAVQTYFNSDFLIAPGKKISTSNGSTDNLYLTTTDSSKLIYTDRNVGIGTSTNAGFKLDVAGTARVNGRLDFATDGAGGNGLYFVRNSTNTWKLDTSGVGEVFRISGNTFSVYQDTFIYRGGLTVSPTITSSQKAIQINHTWNNGPTEFHALDINITDTSSAAGSNIIDVSVGGTTGFVVNKDFSVGVGTDSPSYKLHTVGTFGLQAAGTGTNENFKILDGSAGTIMQVLDNGNVGIGGNAETSASYKLRVHGGIWAGSFEQLNTLNGTAGVGRIEYYNTGGSHRTLGFRTYGPHAAESVKGFIEISSQVLTYSGMGNIVLHADADFADHPTLVLRSLNTAADSFYMQNYHHDLGALFITKATTGGDDSMRFRPGRTSDVLVVSTTGIEVTGSIVKTGGTSSQFLKADGSVDSNSYSTTSHNHDSTYVNVTGDTMTGNLSIKGTSATLTLSKTDDDQYLKFVGGTGGANQLIQTSYNLGIDTGGAGSRTMTLLSSGNVGIGTANPTNTLQVQPSLTSFDLNGLSNGAIALTNNSNGSIAPTIGGKSTTTGQPGLQIIAGTNDTNTNADMSFGVRESDNTDFATTSSAAFAFNRYITNLLTILRNGNVGIGTTAPKTIFDIRPAGITGLTMPTFGTAAYGGIHIVPSGSATTEAWYGITFGNTASTSSEREGSTAGIYTSASGTYGNKLYFATSNSWATGAVSRMMIDHTGNVGIGTTSPSAKLHIVGANSNSEAVYLLGDANYGASIHYDRGGSYAWRAGVGGGSSTSSIPSSYWGIEDVSVGTTRLSIAHTTGYVGVGITLPTARLYTKSSGNESALIVDGSTIASATANKVFDVLKTSGPSAFSVRSNGLVYVGLGQLYVESNSITGRYYDSRINFGTADLTANTTNANLEFYGGFKVYKNVSNVNTEIFRVTNGGNTGINTTVPAEKLHVVGNVRIEGGSTSATLETTDKAAVPTGAIIASYPVASTYGALIDYVIYDTNRDNMRVGTMRAVWNNGDAVYNDVSTVDIGNTDPVILSAVINGTNVDLVVTGDITFTIKASIKVIR